MAFNIKDNITWVGKVDWELRRFHGEEYHVDRATILISSGTRRPC